MMDQNKIKNMDDDEFFDFCKKYVEEIIFSKNGVDDVTFEQSNDAEFLMSIMISLMRANGDYKKRFMQIFRGLTLIYTSPYTTKRNRGLIDKAWDDMNKL